MVTTASASDERPMGFDLFFIDEHMGSGLAGSEVISRLHSTRAQVGEAHAGGARRILLVSVTAGADEADATRLLLRAGADLVWNKPLPEPFEMARLLNAKLEGASSSGASSSGASGV